MFMHLIPAVCGGGIGDIEAGNVDFISEERYDKGSGGKGKALILVSGIELASQTELAAKRILGDGWSVEVEQGNRSATGRADV